MLAFVPHTTNGATVTLNVDGLGSKPLRSAPGVELSSGVMVQGTPYVATYNNSDGAWYLQGYTINPYIIPIGGLMPYLGATAPNSSFVLPFGQAVSRTTYATLFSLVGTTFGAGDGSTTFNILDLRGRGIFGQDNMGGSAANRITVAGGNFDGTVLGGTGGGQNHTLVQAELPAIKPGITITDPGHIHSFSAAQIVGGANVGGSNFAVGTQGANTASATTGISAAFTSNLGSGNAMPVLSPAMTLPYILRVI
jgi:microcystin-dependent protein